jgi:hypothetical protein
MGVIPSPRGQGPKTWPCMACSQSYADPRPMPLNSPMPKYLTSLPIVNLAHNFILKHKRTSLLLQRGL